MRFWYKSLVHLCIEVAIGSIVVNVWVRNWTALPGWIAGLLWAIGGRFEVSAKENAEEDAQYWMGVANAQMEEKKLDKAKRGVKRKTRRFIGQKDLDEMRQRVLKYDFSEPEKESRHV